MDMGDRDTNSEGNHSMDHVTRTYYRVEMSSANGNSTEAYFEHRSFAKEWAQDQESRGGKATITINGRPLPEWDNSTMWHDANSLEHGGRPGNGQPCAACAKKE